MSEAASSKAHLNKQAVSDEQAVSAISRRTRYRLIAWFVLVGLICMAAAFLTWYEMQQKITALRAEVAEHVLKNDQLSRDNARHLNEIRIQLSEISGRLLKLSEENADIQAQQATLESLYKGVVQQDDRRLLDEIERLLRIAGQELQLAGDVRSAISALETADLMLSQPEYQARFLSLRKAVAADLEALKTAPEIDLSGIAIKLEQLIHTADKLPLISSATVTASSETPVQPAEKLKSRSFLHTLADDLWSELRQLVQVRYVDRPEAALLSPQQAFFVRENLKLRLLAARINLLSRANTDFHQDLSAAAALIQRYFDLKHQNSVAALRLIEQLQRQQLQIQWPTLEASYAALKQLSAKLIVPVTGIKGAS